MSVPRLDYVYEDVSDPLGGRTRVADRFAMLGRPAPAPAMGMAMGAAMARPPQAELLGANAQAVRLEGKSVNTQVALDPQATRKLSASFAPRGMGMAGAATEPDRVFLNLENIRGGNDGVIFDIYVGLPPGAKPEDHPENRAGAVALFGVAKASRDDGGHGGNGLVKVVEITKVIDALHSSRRSTCRNSTSSSCRGTSCCRRTTSRSSGSASTGRASSRGWSSCRRCWVDSPGRCC